MLWKLCLTSEHVCLHALVFCLSVNSKDLTNLFLLKVQKKIIICSNNKLNKVEFKKSKYSPVCRTGINNKWIVGLHHFRFWFMYISQTNTLLLIKQCLINCYYLYNTSAIKVVYIYIFFLT